MKAEIMETPYSRAWAEFRGTAEFDTLMRKARREPTADMYLENRIRAAFDAGWNRRASQEFYGTYNAPLPEGDGEQR